MKTKIISAILLAALSFGTFSDAGAASWRHRRHHHHEHRHMHREMSRY
jgi:hypothetical protein